VQLLWGLAISGALSYELWDVLSAPLDTVSAPLEPPLLQQVFQAYCLAVLRNSGPAACEILMPQLVPAGQAFCQAVLEPAAAGRGKLLAALQAAGLMPGDCGVTRLEEGHMVLFDVYNAGGGGCAWLRGSGGAGDGYEEGVHVTALLLCAF